MRDGHPAAGPGRPERFAFQERGSDFFRRQMKHRRRALSELAQQAVLVGGPHVDRDAVG